MLLLQGKPILKPGLAYGKLQSSGHVLIRLAVSGAVDIGI